MRYSRFKTEEEELNVWPAFTDLMSNAFMILSLFLILAIIKSVFVQSVSEITASRSQQLERELQQRSNRVSNLEGEIARMRGELQERSSRITQLNQEIDRLKSPPIIVLRDSTERRFESGSAELSASLNEFVENELIEQITTLAQDYQGYLVEVIGHTDGQINSGGYSNLDGNLEQIIRGNESLNQLIPGSNADLGLMRALAVVKKLQDNQELRELGLTFKAYSAAQLYDLSGNYAPPNRQEDPSRRRIEIRFTPPAEER